ncbi:MAG: Gfo/Idh/MocA family oxidoreductase [Armatimonadetes bacterium]|nr:Gfo/Idh/MocA family oxidoreductase [Armatimonadota bacterium]
MAQLNRRTFLYGSLATGAAALGPRRAYSANDEIHVAVIGFNGRGAGHISSLSNMPGVKIVALCDVDPAVLNRHVAALDKKGIKVEAFTDLRRVMDHKGIHAITTATPNHWHSLIGIWACQAGKDSYIEKPISHNVWEGRQLVKAARKYKRVVQGGTQSRSNTRIPEAIAWLRQGNLGKIKVVTGYCYKARQPIGNTGHGTIPAGLDYDLWCGPAPMEPLRRSKLHYDWHWVYDTGNGDMGNQGIHQMDIARWFLGASELSPRVLSIGGRLGYEDNGETPNTQVVYHDYEPAPLIFETRGLPAGKQYHEPRLWGGNMDNPFGLPRAGGIGVIVECEGGKLLVVGGGSPLIAVDRDGKKIREFQGGGDDSNHMANWIQAVRDRKPETLHAESVETHLSSALCHTGMIAHQLGKQISPGEMLEQMKADPVASERVENMKAHLARNGVDLSATPLTLGPALTFDPKKERFLNNDAANEMLTRQYRKGYAVPSRV